MNYQFFDDDTYSLLTKACEYSYNVLHYNTKAKHVKRN